MATSTYAVEFDRLFSSDPANGARGVSADGSSFEVEFSEPMAIPANAVSCTLSVVYATIWNTVPNIVAGVNDTFAVTYDAGGTITVSDALGPGTIPSNQIFTIPTGHYDLGTLDAAMERALFARGFKKPWSLHADTGTGRINLFFDDTALDREGLVFGSHNWPLANSMGPIIGWPGNEATLALCAFPIMVRAPLGIQVTAGVNDRIGFTSWGVLNTDPLEQNVFFTGMLELGTVFLADHEAFRYHFTNRLRGWYAANHPTYDISSLAGYLSDHWKLTPSAHLNHMYLQTIARAPNNIPGMPWRLGIWFNTTDVAAPGGPISNSIGSLLGWPGTTALYTDWPTTYMMDNSQYYQDPPPTSGWWRWYSGPVAPNSSDLAGRGPGDPHTAPEQCTLAHTIDHYYVINSDLVTRGIGTNGAFDQAIAQVLPHVEAGLQMIYEPYAPPLVDMSNAIGTRRTRARFWLTDDDGAPVDTQSEHWTLRCRISYRVPIVSRDMRMH